MSELDDINLPNNFQNYDWRQCSNNVDEIVWVSSPFAGPIGSPTITINGIEYCNFVTLTSLPVIVNCGIGHTGNNYVAVIVDLSDASDTHPQLVQEINSRTSLLFPSNLLYGRGHNINSAVMGLLGKINNIIDGIRNNERDYPKMADEDFAVRPFDFRQFYAMSKSSYSAYWSNNILCKDSNSFHVNETSTVKGFLAEISIEPKGTYASIPLVVPLMRVRGSNIQDAITNLNNVILDNDFMVEKIKQFGLLPDMATEHIIRYYELFK